MLCDHPESPGPCNVPSGPVITPPPPGCVSRPSGAVVFKGHYVRTVGDQLCKGHCSHCPSHIRLAHPGLRATLISEAGLRPRPRGASCAVSHGDSAGEIQAPTGSWPECLSHVGFVTLDFFLLPPGGWEMGDRSGPPADGAVRGREHPSGNFRLLFGGWARPLL